MSLTRLVRFGKLCFNIVDDIWRISAWENVTWSMNGTNDRTAHQKRKSNIKARASKEEGTFKDR